MRRISNKSIFTLCLIATATLGGCASWPGLDDPTTTIAPELTLFRMTGKTRMESGTPPLRTSTQNVRDLAAHDREENVGGTIAHGDGFSGLELHYARFESHQSKTGRTRDGFGNLPLGAEVDSRVTMDEFRLRYVAGVFDWQSEDEGRSFQAGIGVLLGHKEMTFDLRDVATNVTQKIEIKDDVTPMLAVRLKGQRGPLAVVLDLAYNDDWSVGTGDLEGGFYDASVYVRYYLEAQDLTLFGGYRRFEIPARGREDVFEYDTDFTLDGYVFGFEFVF